MAPGRTDGLQVLTKPLSAPARQVRPLREKPLRQQLGLCPNPCPLLLSAHRRAEHHSPDTTTARPREKRVLLREPLTMRAGQGEGPWRNTEERARFPSGLTWPGDHAGTGGHHHSQPDVTGAHQPTVLSTAQLALVSPGQELAEFSFLFLRLSQKSVAWAQDREWCGCALNSFEEKCDFSPSCQETSGSSFSEGAAKRSG